MAIVPAKKLLDLYVVQNALLSNSITVSVGDAMIVNSSSPNAVEGAAGTTGIILGTVLVIKNGAPSGNVFLQEQTVTTAANNTTAQQISVDLLITNSVTTYIADLDAAAGTTTNSQYFGYFNLSSSVNGELHEASYAAATEKQFFSFGVNPGNQSQVIGTFTKIAQL